jgi:hypothetical protein
MLKLNGLDHVAITGSKDADPDGHQVELTTIVVDAESFYG